MSRIALAIKYIAGRVGGAERVVCEAANALSNAGHEVAIFNFEDSTEPPMFALNGSVRVINSRYSAGPIRSLKGEAEAQRALGKLAGAQWLGTWVTCIEDFRPDLVILYLPHTFGPLSAALAPHLKTVVALQNTPEEEVYCENSAERELRIAALRRASAVTVLLPPFVEMLPASVRAKTKVHGNHVELDVPRADPGSGPKRVIGVGRLVPQKGFDVLISALSGPLKERPEWSAAIYGDGAERSNLLGVIEESDLVRRCFLGGTSLQIAKELAASAIFVIPSVYEGFGLALAEAMAAELPVIGFKDCKAVAYLVAESQAGIIVEHREPSALAETIASLMDNAPRRRQLGAAGRRYAERQLTRQAFAKELNQVVSSLA